MLQTEAVGDKPDLKGFDTADAAEIEATWSHLSSFGVAAVPHLVTAYRTATTWQGRAAAILFATRFARQSEDAFQLGLEALRDRSRLVRSRACGLLAYSMRREAEGRLMLLRNHADLGTRDDAEAALVALEAQDHHRFKDRSESGRVFWIVVPSDLPDP